MAIGDDPQGAAGGDPPGFPPELLNRLTGEQRAVLGSMSRPASWRRHPVNLRLSLPFLSHRVFLTIVGGEEHRGAERLRSERARNPLFTLGNLLFLSLFVVAWAALGLVGLAMWNRGFPLIDPTSKRLGGPPT